MLRRSIRQKKNFFRGQVWNQWLEWLEWLEWLASISWTLRKEDFQNVIGSGVNADPEKNHGPENRSNQNSRTKKEPAHF